MTEGRWLGNDIWLHDPTKTTIFGIPIQQKWTDLVIFEKIFNQEKLSCVIEAGTYQAGLSLYLWMHCFQREIEFYTFDMRRPNDEYLQSRLATNLWLEGHCFQENVFDPVGTMFLTLKNHQKHPMLVLCDGGDKVSEFRTFPHYLLSGDIIGVHDWNWEIRTTNVEKTVEKLNLSPYLEAECMRIESMWRFWRLL